ncbi:MAG TPA: adenylate/guanylate cyclase domain-containing protein [Chromatiaceae bacterium]|jgi:adenylate cyclase|nr:adenylate/guanylate cyclase domain-containing protein [Chromatiaceae bacterium]HIA08431.1 adenylate/guanylate cyclase domain-containing protein [Chromatiaceae bacterium]HIN82510.1 adenylate/guanylate cyclase domain-containing protein [Chromatiales bacterium]HIO53789.1 adenylate/guanylate cyclase domain-containing protein [Chromatiales bacterium]
MIFGFTQTLQTLLFGSLVGIAGVMATLLPTVLEWDEHLGLSALFYLRGEIDAPQEALVVAMDRASADVFGLPDRTSAWPRQLHAQLLDALTRHGAKVVVFDINFDVASDSESDDRLAQALTRAGNVVLFAPLEKEHLAVAADGAQLELELRRMRPPIEKLASAAAAIAPFPLPKIPARVAQFWVVHAASGNQLTLPARAWQLFLQHHEPAAELAESHYLNFYGYPQRVDTVSYAQVMAMSQGDPAALTALVTGRAVFIGYSAAYQLDEQDGFYTAFSSTGGLDLSGVEIAATAFLNLLHDTTLSYPDRPRHLMGLLLWGMCLCLMMGFVSMRRGMVGLFVVALAYVYVAYRAFSIDGYWMPMVVPLMLQLPLALFVSLAWRYTLVKRERERIRRAFGHYVPADVVNQIAGNFAGARVEGENVYGVFLSSDADRYTSLSEKLPSDVLAALMGRYYERLFTPIRARDGVISDIVGDSMLAFWPSPEIRVADYRHAYEAALLVADAAGFSDPITDTILTTRVGLHAGPITVGSIGALDHYEYRAVGDIVNVASRIQGLAKKLGVFVAASETIALQLEDQAARYLGRFRFAGKSESMKIFELRDADAATNNDLCERYGYAMGLFEAQEWAKSAPLFDQLYDEYGDISSRFFSAQCDLFKQQPPVAGWEGDVSIDK